MSGDPKAELQRALGYQFEDIRRLEQALTHRSYVNETDSDEIRDNERLEFLGDAVLDLAVSERLMAAHPDADEGDLSKLRAMMVSEVGLARVAEQVGVGAALCLGRGEELSGGREKASLLADAFEALVASVYRDGGFEPVRALVERLFPVPSLERTVSGDPKSALQQALQSRHRQTPRYVLAESFGPDHDRTFVSEVWLGDACLGKGLGRTKKDAEQRAAANVLAELTDASSP